MVEIMVNGVALITFILLAVKSPPCKSVAGVDLRDAIVMLIASARYFINSLSPKPNTAMLTNELRAPLTSSYGSLLSFRLV